VSVFVIFVRLCDISVLLLGIVMHSGFIWFGRYIFEVQGRSCLERTQVMAFLVVHFVDMRCFPSAILLLVH